MLALFVSMLPSTIVMNALPRIVADLDGTQTGYTWVVVGTLLAMTVATPVWGKLSDLFDKRGLLQTAIAIYCAGAVVGTLAPNMQVLLTARVIQGLGAGGIVALTQVAVAWIAPPSQRGRYAGYFGAVYAIATASGPFIGGLVVDSPVGWRGCFVISLPIAAAAVALLHTSLRLPTVRRPVHLDLVGSTLVVVSASLLLIWLSLAGHEFAWFSLVSALILVAGGLSGGAAIVFELRRAVDPVLPLRLFRDRTVLLATSGAAFMGTAMFASSLYPTQYFQLARGMSATASGLMTVFAVGALGVASVASGRAIGVTGRWKSWLVGGAVLVLAGLLLLGTVRASTPLGLVAAYLFVLGLGLGVTAQNLIVAVQNNVELPQVGAASGLVSFFRSMGGAVGVCVMGAVLAERTSAHLTDALADVDPSEVTGPVPVKGAIPELAELHETVRRAYGDAFGAAFGETFLVVAPLALAAVVCIARIRAKKDQLPPETGVVLRIFRDFGELESARGEYLGVSSWLTIDQERVNRFADVTGDRQWIHVDLARASTSPLGGTIAHGYLTLSLIPALSAEVVRFEIPGARLNYGTERVRFPSPVRTGQRIRAHVTMQSIETVPAGRRVGLRYTVEVEGEPKPACVAETLTMLVAA
ncbi:MFS transporter [Phytohabitans sp. ZYX-F-186]|uniref:MFS transporter n=1 Tax=Phytohabitans maris TaxID=3071409 RepID=A0ABU0ZDU0_9ACTN|nr:MFS transporter [Phytohabitans sp. ZYX-F-186]MDQ7905220.1 MFS transporter [Phytohabitans sp. ZYX-F-186]